MYVFFFLRIVKIMSIRLVCNDSSMTLMREPGICSSLIHTIVSNDSVSGQRRPWSEIADQTGPPLPTYAQRHVLAWHGSCAFANCVYHKIPFLRQIVWHRVSIPGKITRVRFGFVHGPHLRNTKIAWAPSEDSSAWNHAIWPEALHGTLWVAKVLIRHQADS